MSGRRDPRDGIRERWATSVAIIKHVSPGIKVVLLWLIVTERVTKRGYVTFSHEAVADELGVHVQEINKRMRRACEAGLLSKTGGGYRGRTTEYALVLPTLDGAQW